MKRNPRKLGWTKSYRSAHGKEASLIWIMLTQMAMVKFSEVRARRERVFYKNRMSGNRERQIEADRKLVEENQHLLPIELRDVTLKESHIDQEESMLMDEEEMDVDMEIDEKAEAAPLKSAMKTKKVKQTKQVKMKVGGGFEQQ
ncbi:ribosome biogenesis protein RLP24 [Venturia nashicola]|uniref:Ribosome biogenesis protein RLP24 n=1 Tax=Venturia nashicola TaxID=86259 RepID=A0A4Z1PLN4_9PEZI|nr:ribosome biogenesis protein RLP24 [Venturia nashicola]